MRLAEICAHRRFAAIQLAALIAVGASRAGAVTQTSAWTGIAGDSAWSDSVDWNPVGTPSNGSNGVSDYNVVIPSTPQANVNGNFTIDSLTMADNATLNILNNDSLTLEGPSLNGDGPITVHSNNGANPSVLNLDDVAVTEGNDGGIILNTHGTMDLTNASISGASSSGAVVNDGVIVAQTGDNTISGPLTGLGSISVQAGASLGISGSTLSEENSVSIASGGTLDIGAGTLMVNYQNSADPVATIRSELVSGYNAAGARWSGSGIVSSAAAANPTHFTVGYTDGEQTTDEHHTGFTGDSIEIMYTVAGDVNLSGSVDLSDLVIVASDFGMSGADWAEGDLNYDGNVDLSDLVIVASNFGASVASVQTADLSASFAAEWQLALAEARGADVSVPEPCVAGLAIATTLLARRRRL